MKKRYLFLALALISACFYFGCGVVSSPAAKFRMFNPAVALTDAELASLGATGLAGTNEAGTATNILNWQKSKMKLVTPLTNADASYAMRWNYIMPGIFPVNDMIKERTFSDSGTTKLYGVCWDFASIYFSVANKYGLTTRMTAWKKYMSGVPGGEKGMGPDEYNSLNVKLAKNSLNFSYDTINAAARETWIHYRAEVFINGAWVAFDGTDPTGDYAVDSNYSEVTWKDGADPTLTQE